ncbi:MAG: hypothetical protein ABEI27_10765 [Halobellus sp.]|uniref:DUF5789 family protein n=1 Tax=Halobellus sp. TaxID=1979212 RepID=UPI0035D4CAF0
MRLPETRDVFVRELTFPTTIDAVIETLGDEQLKAPNGESETIAEVLDHCEQETFRSADELYNELLTFVGEGFIGRKYYDDRGTQTTEDEEVSF